MVKAVYLRPVSETIFNRVTIPKPIFAPSPEVSFNGSPFSSRCLTIKYAAARPEANPTNPPIIKVSAFQFGFSVIFSPLSLTAVKGKLKQPDRTGY